MGGILLALFGIILLFLIKEEGQSAFPYFYAGLIILATINYAISANTVKVYLNGVKPIMISIVSFSLVGPFALFYLLGSDFISHTQTDGGLYSLGALLILSLVCTFFANMLFFKLVQMTDAIFSTSVSFLIPFVALGWGFIDGEVLGLFHVLALILILGGIFLIRRK
jgi:drug/metabolite transporter (DMT)-like permease